MDKVTFRRVINNSGYLTELGRAYCDACLNEGKGEVERVILDLHKLVSGMAFEHGVVLPHNSNVPDERNETKR